MLQCFQILEDVRDNKIDSACAYFDPNGSFRDSDNEEVARGLAFSKMFCIVFAQPGDTGEPVYSPIRYVTIFKKSFDIVMNQNQVNLHLLRFLL